MANAIFAKLKASSPARFHIQTSSKDKQDCWVLNNPWVKGGSMGNLSLLQKNDTRVLEGPEVLSRSAIAAIAASLVPRDRYSVL